MFGRSLWKHGEVGRGLKTGQRYQLFHYISIEGIRVTVRINYRGSKSPKYSWQASGGMVTDRLKRIRFLH